MPEVRAEMVIPAPPEAVYGLAKQVERFPEFLPNVQEVTIVEREGSRWSVPGWGWCRSFERTLKWVEEDLGRRRAVLPVSQPLRRLGSV